MPTTAITAVITCASTIICMFAALIAYLARKDSSLVYAKMEAIRNESKKDIELSTSKLESVRLEMRADSAAMELRLTNLFTSSTSKDSERLARIESASAAAQSKLELLITHMMTKTDMEEMRATLRLETSEIMDDKLEHYHGTPSKVDVTLCDERHRDVIRRIGKIETAQE